MSWDGMRYDANYLPQGLPNIYSQEPWLSLLPMYVGTPAIAQAISVNPVSPSTHCRSVLCQAKWWRWWEMDFLATLSWPAQHICQSHSTINIVSMIIQLFCQNMSHGITYLWQSNIICRYIIIIRVHLRSAFQNINLRHGSGIYT
jgi:hypothetical protein